jgi:hypothetical protein
MDWQKSDELKEPADVSLVHRLVGVELSQSAFSLLTGQASLQRFSILHIEPQAALARFSH